MTAAIELTPALADALVAAVAGGISLDDGARAQRISRGTVARWLARGRAGDPAYSDLVSRIQAAREARRAPKKVPRAPRVPMSEEARRAAHAARERARRAARTEEARAEDAKKKQVAREAEAKAAGARRSEERARDTRPSERPAGVAHALEAAAAAAATALPSTDTRGPRVPLPDDFAARRTTYHALPDDVRRGLLWTLIREEGARLDVESKARFGADPSRNGQHRGHGE